MKNKIAILLAISLNFYVMTLYSQENKVFDLYSQTSEMANMMIQFEADHRSIIRFYSSDGTRSQTWDPQDNGYHTPECRQRLLDLIRDYLLQIEGMRFEAMNINGQVDYILFKRNLDDEAYQLKEEEQLYQKIAHYLPFSDRIFALEKPRRRGAEVQGEAVAKELDEIRKMIVSSLKELKKIDSIEIKQANMASDAANGLKGILQDYYLFYNGYDPLFSWWVPATYTAVDSLLAQYAGLLKDKGKYFGNQKDDGSGIIGNPIGRVELIRQLQLEFIPYSPEELVDIANQEFAWCDAELLKASREMGFGDNWKAAQEKVKQSWVEPGKQPEAMYDLYDQSVAFLKKNNLVTIPELAEESWSMMMMSPERQRINPFFLGGESLIISYPTSTMTYEEKMMSMRGNNPHFSRATVHHELIAGHHMQEYMSNRFKPYRHFFTPFWIEGNSLYWEMLLWDMNFPQSPEDRVGMLFWRMHRCARIIFSLNYHLGKWTPQQCIDFLVDRVGHERANAEGEVRRSFTGGYGPLYQIAYMLGGLQFMALKRELVDTHQITYQQYHDAILHENMMPVEMLRAILTNQPLTRDFKTQWRFYKE